MNRASVEERIKNLEERIKRLEERISARLDLVIRLADETRKRTREILDRLQDGEEWKRSIDDEDWEV